MTSRRSCSRPLMVTALVQREHLIELLTRTARCLDDARNGSQPCAEQLSSPRVRPVLYVQGTADDIQSRSTFGPPVRDASSARSDAGGGPQLDYANELLRFVRAHPRGM